MHALLVHQMDNDLGGESLSVPDVDQDTQVSPCCAPPALQGAELPGPVLKKIDVSRDSNVAVYLAERSQVWRGEGADASPNRLCKMLQLVNMMADHLAMQEAIPVDDIGEENGGPDFGDDGTSQAPPEVTADISTLHAAGQPVHLLNCLYDKNSSTHTQA